MLTAKLILLATMIPLSFRGEDRGKRLSPAMLPEAKTGAYRTDNAPASQRRAAPLAALTTERVQTRTGRVSDASADAFTPLCSFETRAFQRDVYEKRRTASTRKFVQWLRENYASEGMSRTRLLGRYFEYVELNDQKPVTERQLLNCIVDYGAKKTRPARIVDGKMTRPTTYSVKAIRRRDS